MSPEKKLTLKVKEGKKWPKDWNYRNFFSIGVIFVKFSELIEKSFLNRMNWIELSNCDVIAFLRDVMKSQNWLHILTCRCARKMILFLFLWYFESPSSKMLIISHLCETVTSWHYFFGRLQDGFVDKSYLGKVTKGIFLFSYRSKVISKKVSHGSFFPFTLTGLSACRANRCFRKRKVRLSFETSWLQEIPFSKELTDNYWLTIDNYWLLTLHLTACGCGCVKGWALRKFVKITWLAPLWICKIIKGVDK